jgi:hypothetical protein
MANATPFFYSRLAALVVVVAFTIAGNLHPDFTTQTSPPASDQCHEIQNGIWTSKTIHCDEGPGDVSDNKCTDYKTDDDLPKDVYDCIKTLKTRCRATKVLGVMVPSVAAVAVLGLFWWYSIFSKNGSMNQMGFYGYVVCLVVIAACSWAVIAMTGFTMDNKFADSPCGLSELNSAAGVTQKFGVSAYLFIAAGAVSSLLVTFDIGFWAAGKQDSVTYSMLSSPLTS